MKDAGHSIAWSGDTHEAADVLGILFRIFMYAHQADEELEEVTAMLVSVLCVRLGREASWSPIAGAAVTVEIREICERQSLQVAKVIRGTLMDWEVLW